MDLPILSANVSAMVTGSSLDGFEAVVTMFLENLNTVLLSDEDFVAAKDDVKQCEKIEKAIKSCKAQMMAECSELNDFFGRLGRLSDSAAGYRLELVKKVKFAEGEKKRLLIEACESRCREFIVGHDSFIFLRDRFPGLEPGEILQIDVSEYAKGKKGTKGVEQGMAKAFSDFSGVAEKKLAELKSTADRFYDLIKGNEHLFPDAWRLIKGCEYGGLVEIAHVRISKAKEAKPEPKHVEVVEEINEETGEIVEVEKRCVMVSIDQYFIDILKDAVDAMLHNNMTTCSVYPKLNTLIERLEKQLTENQNHEG